MALTDRERAILEFERRWWQQTGSKAIAVRNTFDLSVSRYYEILSGLLDRTDALAHDPLLVRRLRNQRVQRRRARFEGRGAGQRQRGGR